MTNLLGQQTEEDKYCDLCGERVDNCICALDNEVEDADDITDDYEV